MDISYFWLIGILTPFWFDGLPLLRSPHLTSPLYVVVVGPPSKGPALSWPQGRSGLLEEESGSLSPGNPSRVTLVWGCDPAAMPGRNHLLFPTLLVDGSGCLRSGFPEFTWILQIVLETSQLHPYPLPFWNSVSQSQGMPHGTAFITKYGIKTVWPWDRPKVRAHIPFVFVPSNTLAFERSKWSPNSINPKLHNLMKMGAVSSGQEWLRSHCC